MRLEDWRLGASCRDTPTGEFFDYERNARMSVPEHLEVLCLTCPVVSSCLSHALKYEEYGYWAGTTAKQRVELRQSLRLKLRRPHDK
jgi:hypothetical protein